MDSRLKPLIAFVAAMMLAACHRDGPPADAYISPLRAWKMTWPRKLRGHDGCDLGELRYYPSDSQIPEFLPTAACFKLSQQKRFSGVWEGSLFEAAFYPGATSLSQVKGRQHEHLLARGVGSGGKIPADTYVLWVSFIGRETIRAPGFGTGGYDRGEIVVDRVLATRRIGCSTELDGDSNPKRDAIFCPDLPQLRDPISPK